MKKLSRMTALLLALMMLVTSVPITALAEITLDTSTWQNWVNNIKDAFQQAQTTTETFSTTVDVPVTAQRVAEDYQTPAEYTTADTSITLPRGTTARLTSVDGAGQWQIAIGEDQWANIAGETGESITLNERLLMNGAATLRCGSEGTPVTVKLSTDTVLADSDETIKVAVSGERQVRTGMKFTAGDMDISTFDAPSDVKQTYNIVINYVFESSKQGIASDPYTATLAEGSSFDLKVTFPTVQGYLPYVNDVEQHSIEEHYSNITENVTINVVYKPTNVNYTVIHYQQNVDNDQYTIESTETKQGLTASQVPEVAKTFEGFYSLLYERPAIAADGSTEIVVYYDRYYYLMNFDMDGGYGTEPVYARYGASIGTVTEPTKAGYVFKGWTLKGVDAKIPETMPAESRTYIAKWEIGDPVNYTVVYWKENADDNGYSYWGQQQKTAPAETVVSGSDDIPTSVSNGERAYFTYNAARTDTDVKVKGDGSTVVNVYYYRNTYTIYFKGISGTCAIEEHTHGTDCNDYLDCLKEEHTHTASCPRYLSCKLTEHEHVASCTDLICPLPEHTEHTADCLKCTKEVHESHSDACCTIPEHTHGTACWGAVVGDAANPTDLAPSDPVDGQVYKGVIYVYAWSYIYIKGQWYNYTGDASNGNVVTPSCGYEQEHQHGTTTCTCDKEIHIHSEENGCYKDVLHTHDDSCYGFICGQAAHKHTDACYTYTCSAEEHGHTNSCYRPCTKLEHTHTNQCNHNSTNNVIYVVTAKYEQNIASVWPTADKFPNITLNGWTIDGITSTAVSKRVNMTSDLCDTSDGLKYAEALTGGNKRYLYYMFESFDQTSPANGNERINRNGTYYDKSETYYQVVNSNATWNQKPITGMTAVTDGVKTEGSNVFLYYTRNRHTFSFFNVNTTVKTVGNVMFEQPLKDYKDSDGNLLREFTPSYPSTLEPDAYVFEGWYTTPECYDGTQFNFETATMPDDNLTLYAHWVPVNRTVKFYLTEKSESIYKPATAETEASFTVSHGDNLNEDYVNAHLTQDAMIAAKPNGSYKFVVWYYYEDGVKKYFDPTTQVRSDLTLYGEWSSDTLKQYTVQYVLKDDHSVKVADDLTGSGLAGTTKTFDAKGGTELYAAYQEGYFPTVQSQSLLLDIESNSLVITFEYVQKDAVPYIVRYVDKDGNELATQKVVAENRKSVVTENFVTIKGYVPDKYQDRLVLNGGEPESEDKWINTVDENGNGVKVHPDNVITFVYEKDDEHAYYKVTHYTQNTDGKSWTVYAESQIKGDIGTSYTAKTETIPGFTYDHIEYVVNKEKVTDVTAEGAKLTADGLEINLYYVRNGYPYQVRYLEEGSGKVLHDPKNGTGKYGQVISESAIDIDGYDKVDPTSATLNIRIDEGEDAPNLNIITFYYKEKTVEIKYQIVGSEGCGTLSSYVDSNVNVFKGTVNGSVPTANEGYHFVGWFKDEECNEAVTESWVVDNKITPEKTTKIGDKDAFEAKTYYAKFEEDEVTINYVAVGPEGATNFGSVDPESENVKILTGVANGSEAKAEANYKFVGWYADPECEDECLSTEAKYVPTKNAEDKWVDGTTYYAKFVLDKAKLVIKKNGMADGESAIFTVSGPGYNGKVVVPGNGGSVTLFVTCGDYTITEDGEWSNRYTVDDSTKNATVSGEKDAEVTFTNTKSNDQWLHDESSAQNVFTGASDNN